MESVNLLKTAGAFKKLAICLVLGGAVILLSTGCMGIKDLMNLNIISNYLSTSLGSSSLGV